MPVERHFEKRCRSVIAAVLLLICGLFSPRPGRGSAANEYAVKAGFLFYFAKFVTWPAASQPNTTVVFGIFGSDPFSKVLEDTVAAQTLGGKNIEVRRVSRLEDARQCRVVFISPSEEPRLVPILDGLKGLPVLTVSDMDNFTARGGIIGFVEQANRIRFSVNRHAAAEAHLRISAQLLELAAAVD